MTYYVIVKNSRECTGGLGYDGPTIDAALCDAHATLYVNHIYSSKEFAETCAAWLSRYNPIGFHVEEYREKEKDHGNNTRANEVSDQL